MANRYCTLTGVNKIKNEYTKINTGFDAMEAHIDGDADKHPAQHVTYAGTVVGNNVKDAIDKLKADINNVSMTGSEHDALVTAALIDEEGIDFGVSGEATYLDGRLAKWEQKQIAHLADKVHEVNVLDYVTADGVTDNSDGIIEAFSHVADNGRIIFPSANYKLDIPIEVTVNNVTIAGADALIDCRGTRGIFEHNGIGGGIRIIGSKNRMSGIDFIGYEVEQGSVEYAYGVLLQIAGDKNKVTYCGFSEGNGGAIGIGGNNNKIQHCEFDTCNNHPMENGDYGAIHITDGYGNKIYDCEIDGQYYSGISLYGTTVSKVKIKNNNIRCTNPLGLNTSMGVYSSAGANNDLEIIGNTIEGVAAECVVIFSTSLKPTKNVVIKHNILKDYDYSAVSILKGDDTNSSGVIISDNVLYGNLNTDNHIYAEQMVNSAIDNNQIYGVETGVGTVSTGIALSSNPANNSVKGNKIHNVLKGIMFSDAAGGICDNNVLYKCGTGINYAYCNAARVTNNQCIECTTDLDGGTSSDKAFVAFNMTSGLGTRALSKGNRQFMGDMQGAVGTTQFYATGKLTAGSATINFYHVNEGDVFMVAPTDNDDNGQPGSLFIGTVNVAGDQILVLSTSAQDDRNFIVWKVFNGISA